MANVIEVFEANLCNEAPILEESGQFAVTEFSMTPFLTYAEAEAHIHEKLCQENTPYTCGSILKSFMTEAEYEKRKSLVVQ